MILMGFKACKLFITIYYGEMTRSFVFLAIVYIILVNISCVLYTLNVQMLP
jgi:hypothetical protein